MDHGSIYNVDLNAPQKSKPKPLIVSLLITVTEPKKYRQWSKVAPKSLLEEFRIKP